MPSAIASRSGLCRCVGVGGGGGTQRRRGWPLEGSLQVPVALCRIPNRTPGTSRPPRTPPTNTSPGRHHGPRIRRSTLCPAAPRPAAQRVPRTTRTRAAGTHTPELTGARLRPPLPMYLTVRASIFSR